MSGLDHDSGPDGGPHSTIHVNTSRTDIRLRDKPEPLPGFSDDVSQGSAWSPAPISPQLDKAYKPGGKRNQSEFVGGAN